MAKEIERKFLVHRQLLPELVNGCELKQAYLCNQPDKTVRVRISHQSAWLTIKGATCGISRTEFEYPIPVCDAHQLIDELCNGRCIEKTRYRIEYAGHCWELDIFAGRNQGLIVAEIELDHEQQAFAKPDWLSTEVSTQARYYNAKLLDTPYKDW